MDTFMIFRKLIKYLIKYENDQRSENKKIYINTISRRLYGDNQNYVELLMFHDRVAVRSYIDGKKEKIYYVMLLMFEHIFSFFRPLHDTLYYSLSRDRKDSFYQTIDIEDYGINIEEINNINYLKENNEEYLIDQLYTYYLGRSGNSEFYFEKHDDKIIENTFNTKYYTLEDMNFMIEKHLSSLNLNSEYWNSYSKRISINYEINMNKQEYIDLLFKLYKDKFLVSQMEFVCFIFVDNILDIIYSFIEIDTEQLFDLFKLLESHISKYSYVVKNNNPSVLIRWTEKLKKRNNYCMKRYKYLILKYFKDIIGIEKRIRIKIEKNKDFKLNEENKNDLKKIINKITNTNLSPKIFKFLIGNRFN